MTAPRLAPALLSGAVAAALSPMALSCGSDAGAEASPPAKPKPDAGVDGAPSEGGVEGGGCSPKTCAQLGASCGSAPDGCGGVVECGTCPVGQSCGGGGPNVCGDAPCMPKSCAQTGASCGVISDGCGATVACGDCSPPQTCGGGGVSNQCGCTPVTCASVGAECGSVADGCGGSLSCGSCGQGTCQDNHCGCTPTTCAEQSAECGTLDNGCGATLSCGSCPSTQLCISYQCGCASGRYQCASDCIAEGTCCTNADCSGLHVCSNPGSACACRTSPSRQPVYHSWWPASGDHFFSPLQGEGPSAGYTGESIAYYVYPAPCEWGLVPFHRLVRVSTTEHFYTADNAEKNYLVSQGWTLEGNVGCLSETSVCGAVPLYRIATYEAKHMFTTDPSERDALVVEGGIAEGVAGYVWKGP